VVEVYPDSAPKTVENFLQYVRDKHYDGTIFHRVIDNFMIQRGGIAREIGGWAVMHHRAALQDHRAIGDIQHLGKA
jgi:cyclophilin family peptidyl-prolyl cis-trans isomerase